MTLETKKIVFWSATVIISAVLLVFWVKGAQKRIDNFRGREFIEGLRFPSIKMPDVGLPKEELGDKIKELEKIIKNAEETTTTIK